MSEMLLQAVKRKLNITWEDSETDARVDDIMSSVDLWLRHKLGVTDASFEFSTPGAERDLFLACCLYEWNHIPRDEFEENYKHMIADVRAQYAVAHYLKEQEATANA